MCRFVFLGTALFCQLLLSMNAFSDIVPFESDRWEFQAAESKFVNYLDRPSIYLKGGLAIAKGSQFSDGIIEFDVAFSQERNFVGTFWRMQDRENYEEFYIRPHQSGNPDANQYEPIFNGMAAWQLYYGEGYGAPVQYKFNEWNHVKLVISGKQADVYINDMNTPVLFVSDQKREIKPGKVGLSVSNFAPAYYSNFSFNELNNPPLKGKAKALDPPPQGTITTWMISNPIASKSLDKKYELSASDKENLAWKKLDSENSGLTNIARLYGVNEETDTVYARLVIESEQEQIKKMRFGFSDAVKTYLNDSLIYGGSDGYRSRDYRFLGTMGYYDELYLPLKKGTNELWIAVTENFGGWGIQAIIEDQEGISIRE
ncbi:MAG TPA: family 16 glycoside hydrolase [Acidobacteriota bacterium]|nr:family 16 glycoside hydrolase [Acidobacteriota bacterium]